MECLQNKLGITSHSLSAILEVNKTKKLLVVLPSNTKFKLHLLSTRPPRPEQQQPDREVSGESADGAAGLCTEDLSR